MERNIQEIKGILIVTPDIHGPIRNGGIGTAFAALANKLAFLGYKVSILYVLGKHSENKPIEHWINYYKMNNINFIPLSEDLNSPEIDAPHWRAFSWKVDRWLRFNSNDYSIFIFPEWMGLAYYSLLAKEQGLAYHDKTFIVNAHSPESWAREGNRNLPDCLHDIDRDFMERESVARADIVISPSKYMFDWMRQNNWRTPSKTRVIQNLMEVVTKSDYVPAKKLANVDRIVFFGRLEMRKGLKLFADAIDLLSSKLGSVKQIVFLGKQVNHGDFNSINYINNRAKRWSVSVNIKANKNRDEALDFLSEPGVLCIIPSLLENSPYTVLECLEKKINFCASNVGGIPELIHFDDHQLCLFEPIPSALAKIIEVNLNSIHEPTRPSESQGDIVLQWKSVIGELLAQAGDAGYAQSKAKSITQIKESEPLVSVCITHHERPIMLKRAIESIRNQTYKKIEVVLVDDGSQSESAIRYLDDLSIEFSVRNWQLLRQDNRYLGAARNYAAAHAHGEYLLFMDDDNVAMPDEIETYVMAIINCRADILTCVAAPFMGSNIPDYPKSIWLPLGGALGPGLFSNAFGDANALWKSCVFHQLGGFTEDYGIGHEDWEIFANAVLSGYRLDVVPEVLFWYHVNPNGMLRRGDPWADHARSVRPYLRHNPGGLGIAVAYAVCLQQIRRMGGMQTTSKKVAISKKIKFLASKSLNPIYWVKLRSHYRQVGIRGTLVRMKDFVNDNIKN